MQKTRRSDLPIGLRAAHDVFFGETLHPLTQHTRGPRAALGTVDPDQGRQTHAFSRAADGVCLEKFAALRPTDLLDLRLGQGYRDGQIRQHLLELDLQTCFAVFVFRSQPRDQLPAER